MKNPSRIAANLAAVVIVTSLFGTSAFAETRHRDETRGQSGWNRGEARQSPDRRSSGSEQPGSRQFDRRQHQGTQTYDGRSRQTWDRSRSTEPTQTYGRGSQGYDRSSRAYTPRDTRSYTPRDTRSYTPRDTRSYTPRDTRSYTPRDTRNYNQRDTRGYNPRDTGGYDRGYGRTDSRHSITMEGRVNRIQHESGGYRVWLDRGGYSYWVPEARFRLWPLRVGYSIRLGGWWDPLGYVNVYDMGPINGPYYTSGDLRGVVESVDYSRGTAVVRDDLSGSFVTIVLRGNDPRLSDLRPGDYVDLAGAWTRNGYFEAQNLVATRDGQGGPGY